MVLLEQGERPASRGAAVVPLLLGLGLFTPLVLHLVRRRKGLAPQRRERPEVPVDVSDPAVFAEHGVRFRYPRAWKVVGTRLDDVVLGVGTTLHLRGPQPGWALVHLQPDAEYFLKGVRESMAEKMADPANAAARQVLESNQLMADMEASALRGFAAGIAKKCTRLMAEATGMDRVEFADADLGPLAGRPSIGAEVTARLRGHGRCQGQTRAVVVGDLVYVLAWLVPEPAAEARQPAFDLIRDTFKLGTASAPAAAAPAAVAAVPAAAAAGGVYHYSKNGQAEGPVSEAQLRQMAAAGKLAPTDMVWAQGSSAWVPAGNVPGLFAAR
jgi:hypothetical protein